jgi:hypothetical protein
MALMIALLDIIDKMASEWWIEKNMEIAFTA